MERDEIIIRNAIVHIMDSSIGIPVLSDTLLELSPDINDFLRGHIFKIASSDDIRKYYEEYFDKHMEAKSILHNEYTQQGSINTSLIGEKIFKDNSQLHEEFVEKLEKYNIEADEVKPRNKQTTKKFEKQFLTTDTGIEINIPMDQYNNKKNVEFITNPDGTISVILKILTILLVNRIGTKVKGVGM